MPAISYPLIWAIIGVALIIAELATFSFILVFFGLGALVTALLAWAGLATTVVTQLVAFSSLSLISLVLFRKTFRKMFSDGSAFTGDYIGQKVTVRKEITSGAEGAIELRGSEWIAFSEEAETIPEGATVRITGVDGIRFKVEKL